MDPQVVVCSGGYWYASILWVTVDIGGPQESILVKSILPCALGSVQYKIP